MSPPQLAVASRRPGFPGGGFPFTLGSWLNASLVGEMRASSPLEGRCSHPLLRRETASRCQISSCVGLPSGDAYLRAVALGGDCYWLLCKGTYDRCRLPWWRLTVQVSPTGVQYSHALGSSPGSLLWEITDACLPGAGVGRPASVRR